MRRFVGRPRCPMARTRITIVGVVVLVLVAVGLGCSRTTTQTSTSTGSPGAVADHTQPDLVALSRNAIEAAYPRFKDWETQKSFAGKSVKSELDEGDHYFAYVVHGSGLPIAEATCFRVDRVGRVFEMGLFPDPVDSYAGYRDVNPRNLQGDEVGAALWRTAGQTAHRDLSWCAPEHPLWGRQPPLGVLSAKPARVPGAAVFDFAMPPRHHLAEVAT